MVGRIIEELNKKIKENEKTALVILTENTGSSPGIEGEMMLINPDGSSVGTIGGGSLEYGVVNDVLAGMERGENFSFSHNLNERGELGMICGGLVKGYVKYFNPGESLVIFGAGHCGQALARVAKGLGFRITVVDDRMEYLELPVFEGMRTVRISYNDLPGPLNLDDAYVVIMTPAHSNDYEVLKTAIVYDFKYLGLMGSGKKVATIKKKLLNEGIEEERVNKLHMPIGLDIATGSPEEIAISIAGELLAVKYKRDSVDFMSNKYKR